MKSQIVPVLIFCLVLPWIASRAFQKKNHPETTQAKREETVSSEPLFVCYGNASNQLINYAGLSTKQITFLIP